MNMRVNSVDGEELEQIIDVLAEDSKNVRRVLGFIEDQNLSSKFILHGKAMSVEDSAENTGLKESEIVKTLVFVGEEPVAVICSGNMRVSETKLEEILDTSVAMADTSTVEEATDYVIGGVSPFDLDIPVYCDERVLEPDEVKPAAGSRCVGAIVDPEELVEAVDAEVVDVAED